MVLAVLGTQASLGVELSKSVASTMHRETIGATAKGPAFSPTAA
jgi:hypothetical protein